MRKSLYYDARNGAGIPVMKVVLTLLVVLTLVGGCVEGCNLASRWCSDHPDVFATDK